MDNPNDAGDAQPPVVPSNEGPPAATGPEHTAPARSRRRVIDPEGIELPVRMGVHWLDSKRALTVAIGVAGGLILADAAQGVLVRLYDLIVILIVSLFLSFGMEPAVKWLEDRGVRRGAGTGLVFLLTFLLSAGFIAAMAPLIVDQVTTLIKEGPRVLEGLAERAQALPGELGDTVAEWLTEQQAELPDRIPELAPRLAEGALGFGTTLLGTVLQALTGLLITFYMVADGPKLRRVLSSRMEPARQAEFLEWWELAVEKTGSYLYGRVLTAVASTVFHVLVFQLIDLPYALALGVWVGLISSVIPIIGTYLAGALPLVIALSTSVSAAIWVLVAITLYQQVENYLIGPRITAHTMEVHPAIAFVSVLIGAALLGAAGALLALPAAAIVSALVSSWGERHEVVEHRLTTLVKPGTRPPREGPGTAPPPPTG